MIIIMIIMMMITIIMMIIMISMLMPIQRNSFTQLRVLLVLTDRVYLASALDGQIWPSLG
jgi:hypothetical protein